MSFLENLGDLAEGDVAGAGNKFLPSLIRQGLGEGLSSAAMLGAFRDAGLGVQTQRFYGLVSEIRATDVMHESVAGMNPASVPGESDFAPWSTSRASGYLYQIRAYGQIVDASSGEIITTFRHFDINSQEIISGYDALGKALDLAPSGGGPGSDATITGLEIVGLFHMEPEAT